MTLFKVMIAAGFIAFAPSAFATGVDDCGKDAELCSKNNIVGETVTSYGFEPDDNAKASASDVFSPENGPPIKKTYKPADVLYDGP